MLSAKSNTYTSISIKNEDRVKKKIIIICMYGLEYTRFEHIGSIRLAEETKTKGKNEILLFDTWRKT